MFNRRAAARSSREIPEREALEKPVDANLFYFEYKVDDEIFSPRWGKSAWWMNVRTASHIRANVRARAHRNFLINSLCANYIFSVNLFNPLTSARTMKDFSYGGSTGNRIFRGCNES